MKTKIFHLTVALILAVMVLPALFLPVTPASASPVEFTIVLRPNGAGNYTEWGTVVGAATHCQAVNETTADDDSSYIEEAASDKRDTFTLTDSGLTAGCIQSVKVCAIAERINSSNKRMRFMIRSGGTDDSGGTEYLSSSWDNKSNTWTTDPDTGLPWTWAAVDALEAGVTTEVSYYSGARVTQLWVEVTYCPLCATLRPNGAGNYTEFDTLHGAASHWEAVDDVTADGDTSYIEDDDYGEEDTFALTDSGLATNACISSVTVWVRARRYDYNDNEMKIMVRSGTTDDTGGNKYLGSSYRNYSETWTNDPNTGSPWTVAAVDALEAGVRNTDGVRATQVWVVVCAAPPVTLTMVADGDGTVSPVSGDYCPDDMTINATADCPAAFAGWTTADMSEIANPTFKITTLTLDKDKTVTGHFVTRPAVQLAMVLDGSDSISGDDFTRIKEGLADVVDDSGEGCFARNGSLELTVVQFGGGSVLSPSWAQLEVGPVAITPDNAAAVADEIRGISKLGGYTPLACGIYLAADLLAEDPNNHLLGTDWEGQASCSNATKQVINIVTDGEPNRCCNDDGDLYETDSCGDSDAYDSAVAARNYTVELLGMETDTQDRILVETAHSAEWFRDEIVWPEESVIATPPFPEDVGWVYQITSFPGTNCSDWQDPDTSNVNAETVNNPDNAFSDTPAENEYAEFTTDDAECEYSGYDLSIPAGVTIDGIQVMLDAKKTGSSITTDFEVALWNDSSSSWTSWKKWNPSTSWGQGTLGSPTDKWGDSWGLADLAEDKFKVRVKWDDGYYNRDGYLDWAPVEVCYHVDYPEEFYDIFCAKLMAPPEGAYPSDSAGALREEFCQTEDVYATGTGFPPNTDVDVYVVEDRKWSDDDAIPDDVGDGMDTVTTDGDGDLGPTVVWEKPLEPGEYDIVFDVNQNGVYNALVDYVDDPNHPGFEVSTVCSADFSAEPIKGAAPLKVKFTDQSTGSIKTWEWDFGDGKTSQAENPTHAYGKGGKYTATLTVSGICGEDTARQSIFVEGAALLEPANMFCPYMHTSPQQVVPNQQVEVSVNVCNNGEERGTHSVTLYVNGQAEQSQTVGVSGGSCNLVVFRVAKELPGTYQVSVCGQEGQFTVLAPASAPAPNYFGGPLGTGGIIAIVAIAIVLIVALLFLVRSTRRE